MGVAVEVVVEEPVCAGDVGKVEPVGTKVPLAVPVG